MKPGARVAAGVGAGYLLGRTRKLRLAFMVAAAGATGAFEGKGALLRKGLAQLGSSPELSKINSTREHLVDAAKSAAVNAATSRMDALTERLAPYVEQPSEPPTESDESDESDESEESEESRDSGDSEVTEEPEPKRRTPAKRVTAHRRTATNRAPVRRASK